MKKTIFIKNALILTITSVILRFAGIIFKVWLAAIVGSEGIGLYQLIFSVYILAATFATSGISTAVTRLVAEELALGKKKGTIKILRRSIQLTLIIAVITIILLYFSSDFIAIKFLNDSRAIPALKILSLSLPFMGICSCLRGYFIARRNATPNAISQLAEQAIRIILVVTLVKKFASKGLAACCCAVMAGDIAAEMLSSIILYTIYLKDKNKLNNLTGRQRPPFGIVRKILHISIPITSGRYLNTALRTIENLLVPNNLAKYSKTGNALSQFGMIKGMALPILFFPSAILNSISVLLIPEISEASVKNQDSIVKKATQNIIKLTSIISFIFASIFFIAGKEIGILIYKSEDVGFLLQALSPIVPLMYLDSISDGLLKGLDQQNFSFRTAIIDSVARIILILIILPYTGMLGFIGIMYFSNILTCFLNIRRLLKITQAKLKVLSEILLPLITSISIALFVNTGIKTLMNVNNMVYIILAGSSCIIFYTILLFVFGVLKKEEITNMLH